MRNRIVSIGLLVLAVAVFAWLVSIYGANLRNPRYMDGWVLLIVMFGQVAFRVRRSFPDRAWGRVGRWTRMHIYTGYFAVCVFIMHSNFAWPNSRLGWILWCLFVLVTLSGMVGTYLTMSIPGKLQLGLEPVRFEELKQRRYVLASEAEALVARSVSVAELQSLSDFYMKSLHSYFDGPRDVWAHLRGSSMPLSTICAQLDRYRQLGGSHAASTFERMKELVTTKSQLDRRFANEGALKLWLFLHVPATYCLLAVSVLHVLITYAYTSGVP